MTTLLPESFGQFGLSQESNVAILFALDASVAQANLTALDGKPRTPHVGTEHLLLGLLVSQEVREALAEVGVSFIQLMGRGLDYLAIDDNHPDAEDGFTFTAINALIFATRERIVQGRQQTEPRDILIGMLQAELGMAAILLEKQLPGGLPSLREHRIEKKEKLAERLRAHFAASQK